MKIYRYFKNLNVKLIIGFVTNFVLLLTILFFSILSNKTTNNMDMNINEINKGYDKEDINAINEVRELFFAYTLSAEYDKLGIPELDIADLHNDKTYHIIEEAQRLLRKYGKVQVDVDTFISFDRDSRYITLINGICTFETNVNVDIPISNYYLFPESFVPTANGSWCVYPSGLDNKFLFFQFGSNIKSSTIEADCAIEMIDKRFVNSCYFDHYDERPYAENTKYYLFKSIVSNKIYIYNVTEKSWTSIDEEVRDIKVNKNFISIITTKDNFYMYCIKDTILFKVGKTKKSLYSSSLAYIPDDDSYDFKDIIKKCHKECTVTVK